MLAADDIVAFIATADARRARAFYEAVLGLRLVEDVTWFKDPDGNLLSLTQFASP